MAMVGTCSPKMDSWILDVIWAAHIWCIMHMVRCTNPPNPLKRVQDGGGSRLEMGVLWWAEVHNKPNFTYGLLPTSYSPHIAWFLQSFTYTLGTSGQMWFPPLCPSCHVIVHVKAPISILTHGPARFIVWDWEIAYRSYHSPSFQDRTVQDGDWWTQWGQQIMYGVQMILMVALVWVGCFLATHEQLRHVIWMGLQCTYSSSLALEVESPLNLSQHCWTGKCNILYFHYCKFKQVNQTPDPRLS